MKRLFSLVSGLISLSVLTACGSETISLLPATDTALAPQTSIQSNVGLKSFYSAMTEVVFKMVDQNKDNFISFDEFRARPHIGLGVSQPANPPQPQPEPAAPVVSAQTAASSPVLTDPLQIFLKIDRNKDGKLTLNESKASKYFLGFNQTQLRTMLAKPVFDSMNTDKNKVVSKDEFLKGISAYDPMMQRSLLGMFFSADKNADSSLTFSEFEDLLYASFKANWEVPMPAPQPVPAEPVPAEPTQPVPAEPAQPAQP